MDEHIFDHYWDRSGPYASKWQRAPEGAAQSPGFTPLALMGGDMDFATAPSVLTALRERMDHPLFGGFEIPDRYYDAISYWHRVRYGVKGLQKHDISYENSVLAGMASAIQACTKPGDAVLVNTPAHMGFTILLQNIGREAVFSPLSRDKDGIYRMNLSDMGEKIRAHKIRCAIFCSPHNPTGRVWEREELTAYVDLMDQLGVRIISDEIWSDFVLDEHHRHIPLQSVSEKAKAITAAFYSPSKTFNTEGLAGAYSVIYDPELREKTAHFSALTRYNVPNIFSCAALWGGYEEGAEWVDALLAYLRKNRDLAIDYTVHSLPALQFSFAQGTCMMMADLSLWCRMRRETLDEVLQRANACGVWLTDCRPFLLPDHIRLSFASQSARLEDALCRLKDHVLIEE